MKVDFFDFGLPEDRIALRPVSPRRSARMLVIRPGEGLEDRHVTDLPELLNPSDIPVFNDTKVIPARLYGTRSRAGGEPVRVEVLLHLREGPARWRAFARPGKRLKPGDRIRFGDGGTVCPGDALDARIADKGDGGEITLDFDFADPVLDERIAAIGEMPLPPYIQSKRPADARDAIDYQTVFADKDGAVAAPTAALHFDNQLLANLDDAGIRKTTLTLHVGAGTFLPVKAGDTASHRMHAEWGEVSAGAADDLNAARARGGRIVAVGTTALRLLETATDEDGTVQPWSGPTDIFITPGYRFRAVDVLMTNFHLPRSTLFMLVSAFAGLDVMQAAYAHAIAEGYRFYSYGDSSLLFRAD